MAKQEHPHLRETEEQEARIKERHEHEGVPRREAIADELQHEMETKTPLEAIRDDMASVKEDIAETFSRDKHKD
jgi:hypothetical protein